MTFHQEPHIRKVLRSKGIARFTVRGQRCRNEQIGKQKNERCLGAPGRGGSRTLPQNRFKNKFDYGCGPYFLGWAPKRDGVEKIRGAAWAVAL